MSNYDLLGEYYDELMGNPISKAHRIDKYIQENNPNARNILEMACGTGSILYNLPLKYQKVGFDLSAKMIEKAKQKLPNTEIYQADMVSFHFERKFDVVLCIYDSINHLLNLEKWEKSFQLVHRHLNENGLFIFDMNTLFRLRNLSEASPQVQQFGIDFKHVCFISVSKQERNIFNWTVKIFEHQQANKYLLFEENILEKTFLLNKVRQKLLKKFTSVSVQDDNYKNPSSISERLWFVCKK